MKTKNLFIGLFAFAIFLSFNSFAVISSNDEDTEQAGGMVWIPGTLFIDDAGVLKFESTACEYQKTYTLGGILDENSEDKKVNKKNKKLNKKAAKEVAKETKRVNKAGGKIENVDIKGLIGQGNMENFLSPKRIVTPMKKPIVTGLAPAADAYLLAVWGLWEQTQAAKKQCRVLTVVPDLEKSTAMDEVFICYDSNCNLLTYDQAVGKAEEAKKMMAKADLVVIANLAMAIALTANYDKAMKEIDKLEPLQKIAAVASLAQALVRQGKLMDENKRLKDKIKESKERIKKLQGM